MLIVLIPLLSSCESLPMLLREVSIVEKFELDVQHKKSDPKPSLLQDMPSVRGADTSEGEL